MQGRLRSEALSFGIDTECGCCGRAIRLTMGSDLSYELGDPTSSPMYLIPLVDFTRLRAPSIVNAF